MRHLPRLPKPKTSTLKGGASDIAALGCRVHVNAPHSFGLLKEKDLLYTSLGSTDGSCSSSCRSDTQETLSLFLQPILRARVGNLLDTLYIRVSE